MKILADILRKIENLLENKHMNTPSDDTNMTGNADCDALRTKSGQGTSHGENFSIRFRTRDAAIESLCRRVFGAFPIYAEDTVKEQSTKQPKPNHGLERIYMLDQYFLACRELGIGKLSTYPGDTLLEAVCRLKRELAEARDQIVSSEAVFSKFRDLISRALDAANTPTHHLDIGAPARKPMMSTERIKALAEQRDTLAEALESMWPFIEEDDHPNCNTPAFSAAIAKYKAAIAEVKGGSDE